MIKKELVAKISIFILVALGVFALFNKIDAMGRESAHYQRLYNNQLAAADSLKAVAGGYERMAFQQEGLVDTLSNKNVLLANTIKDREEEIFALTEANIELNNIILKGTEETGAVVDSVVVDSLGNERVRVDFCLEYDLMDVVGYTLTNPAEANVLIDWTKPIGLTSVISRNEEGRWFGYLSSPDSLFTPIDLNVRVDNDLFNQYDKPWYRRFVGGVGATGTGVLATLSWERRNSFYGFIYENKLINDKDNATGSNVGFILQRRF